MADQLNFLPKEESGDQTHSEEYLGIVYSLRESILPQQEGSTNVIIITATARDASLSAKMANAVAHAYQEFNIKSQNRMVTESRQFIEFQLRALESKLSVAIKKTKGDHRGHRHDSHPHGDRHDQLYGSSFGI